MIDPAARLRILFVDDEEDVLHGLENLFYRQRRVWDMAFAHGGKAALEHLAQHPCDVIVSDMRMPGMDGASLLEHVNQRYPQIARVILSGHAERQAVIRVVPYAHQFLSKPCDPDALRSVIDRTLRLKALLEEDRVKKAVGRLRTLPSAPSVYIELCNAARQPEIGLATIAAIVERDPAMSAKILQLVNSAYFGISRPISSIQQAVNHLGLDLVKCLTLSAHVFSTIDRKTAPSLSLDALQAHSLRVARLASRIVADRAFADDAFAAGMLHDVGKIVLAMVAPTTYNQARKIAEAEGRPLSDVERERFAVSHAEAGAYLLGVWGLPFRIIEAVAFHHRPSESSEVPSIPLVAVHVADAIIRQQSARETDPDVPLHVDMAFLEATGFADALPKWIAMAEDQPSEMRM